MTHRQREALEAGLHEASALVRDFKPLGNPQEILAKQKEFTKKVFRNHSAGRAGQRPIGALKFGSDKDLA